MKIKKKLLIIPGLLLAALASVLGQSAQMTLEEAVKYAQDKHPSVRLAQIAWSDADWQIRENTATAMPQFTGTAGYSYFFQKPESPLPSAFLPRDSVTGEILPGVERTASFVLRNSLDAKLQYSQLLFSNSYRIAKKAARGYRDWAAIQLDVAKASLRNSVRDAYLPALILTENVAVLDKNISNLEKLRSETAATNKAGFVEQLDVDRLDLSLMTLRNERENLLRQRGTVVDALKFAMGYPPTDPLTPTDDLKKLLAQIADEMPSEKPDFGSRPEWQSMQKASELRALQATIYEKPWMPTVASYASYGYQMLGDNLAKDGLLVPSGGIVGLTVNVPIWNGGLSKAQHQRALLAEQTLRTQQKMLENGLTFEAQAARSGLEIAKSKQADAQKSLDLAQRIYETTEKKYRAGVGSSVELVLSEQSLYSAQAAVLNAQFEVLKARVAVQKSMGR